MSEPASVCRTKVVLNDSQVVTTGAAQFALDATMLSDVANTRDASAKTLRFLSNELDFHRRLLNT